MQISAAPLAHVDILSNSSLQTSGGFLGPQSWVFKPSAFVLFFAALELAHIILRPILSATAGVDDVDQLFFSQALRLVYSWDQVPLYSWIVWASTQLFGPTILATAAVKYSLIFFVHLFAYLAARRVLSDPRLQVAAGFSPMFFYSIGWRVHEADTHAVLASALMLALTWLLLRLRQRGDGLSYLAFGATAGLGLIASGWFVVGLLALLLATLLQGDGRKALLCPRALLILPLLVAIPGPYLVWVFDHWADFWPQLQSELSRTEDGPELDPWWLRLAYIGHAFFVTSFPFNAGFIIIFWPALRRLSQADSAVAFLRLYGLALVALLAVIVLLLKAEKLYAFLMQPYLLVMVPFLFRRVELSGYPEARLRWFALMGAVLIVVVFQSRFQHMEAGPAFCDSCRMQTPYPSLADSLRAEGFSGHGTIIASDNHFGGNFRVQFPEARVITGRFPLFDPGLPADSAPDANCLVVWQDWTRPAMAEARDKLMAALSVPPLSDSGFETRTLPIPHTPRIDTPEQLSTFHYKLYTKAVGSCR